MEGEMRIYYDNEGDYLTIFVGESKPNYGEDISEESLKGVEKNDRIFLRVNIGEKKTNDELWRYLEKEGYPV